MSKQSFNINEAAKKLGVSTRTIRRYIKAGKIRAELVKGSFGEEYRILELPPQFDPNQGLDSGKAVGKPSGQESGSIQGMELIRELHEKNLALAAQLGAAAERIHNLEGQLKLLAAPKDAKSATENQHWWQRLQHLLPHRKSA
jgi:MerR family copper efflux transcriptional regulator